MKKNTIQALISIIIRYLWLLCLLLIIIDLTGNLLIANSIIRDNADNALISVQNEIKNRIDVTISLLEGICNDDEIIHGIEPIEERVKKLNTYSDSFNLILIGLINKNGLGSSTYNTTPMSFKNKPYFSAYETGRTIITSVNGAELYGVKNFSIVVPVKDKTSDIAMAVATVNYDDIDKIISRKLSEDNFYYLILDDTGYITSHPDPSYVGTNIKELDKDSIYFYDSKESFYNNLENSISGNHLCLYRGDLFYTNYMKIPNTNWTLVLRSNVFKSFESLFIQFLVKSCIYIVIFCLLSFFGNKYMQFKLLPVNNVINQVSKLNNDFHYLEKDSGKIDDISQIIEASQKGLRDELTGLATRTLFHQILKAQMEIASLSQYSAIFYIDMDNLKEINDSFSHQCGDEALIYFGEHIQSFCQNFNCTACRYGGDEFIIFALNISSVSQIENMAEEIVEELNGHITVHGKPQEIHASIGISIYPIHSGDINEIIHYADHALYYSKQHNKGGYTIYQPPCTRPSV